MNNQNHQSVEEMKGISKPASNEADTTADTKAKFARIKAAVELVSRLYLQKRPPRKADFQIIHDACLAVEEVEAPGFVPAPSQRKLERVSADDNEFSAEIWEVRGRGWAVCGYRWGKFQWGEAFDDFNSAAYRLQRWCECGEVGGSL